MSVKKYDIEIPKLDYYVLSIGIKENPDDTEYIPLGENDLIFMTVSLHPGDTVYKFQKSLSNGITYDSETGKYNIVIDSNDTEDLEQGVVYGYDITIYYNGNKPKQKVIGNFKIGKKFTVNEVS
jgi:hypothetical protein